MVCSRSTVSLPIIEGNTLKKLNKATPWDNVTRKQRENAITTLNHYFQAANCLCYFVFSV